MYSTLGSLSQQRETLQKKTDIRSYIAPHSFIIDPNQFSCSLNNDDRKAGLSCNTVSCKGCRPICKVCRKTRREHGTATYQQGGYVHMPTREQEKVQQPLNMKFRFSMEEPEEDQKTRFFHNFVPDRRAIKGHPPNGRLCYNSSCSLCRPIFCGICGLTVDKHP